MGVKNCVKAGLLASRDSSTVTSSYALVTATAGINNASFLLKIINNSTKDVTVSYDGTNDHDYVPTMTTANIYVGSSVQPNNFIANFAQGTQVWVKGTAGTGDIYVAYYYQPAGN